jgi:hypothetical protein
VHVPAGPASGVTERRDVEELWRRAVDANVRYVEAVSRVTVDYVRALAGVTRNLSAPVRAGSRAPAPPRPEPETPTAPTASPAMVLEGEAGATALGVFLVENHLERAISTPVAASGFIADDGREVVPPLTFDPELVILDPGEQLLVQVSTTIGDELERDVGYRGELTVPGLTGTSVPIVIRRRGKARRPPTASRKRSGGSRKSTAKRTTS